MTKINNIRTNVQVTDIQHQKENVTEGSGFLDYYMMQNGRRLPLLA